MTDIPDDQKYSASNNVPTVADNSSQELNCAHNRKLLLKTDSIALPLIVITSTLAFLDKVRRARRIFPFRNSHPALMDRTEWHTPRSTA